ncbi:MAG TPA: aquaporin [Opitutaceae bacterium]|nr:aquaporin [Opitutaceae bacterium]
MASARPQAAEPLAGVVKGSGGWTRRWPRLNIGVSPLPPRSSYEIKKHRQMKKYLVEFIGTFLFVLVIGLSVRSGSALAPLAIGAALGSLIFAGGYVSGAHYNPAVSLGVLVRGMITFSDWLGYVASQLAGGLLAGLVVVALVGKPEMGVATHEVVPSLIVEFLFTFALVWVVLSVATAKRNVGNSFYGLAIGAVLTAGVIAGGGISGGAYNPAVGLGVFMMGLEGASQLGIYLGAQLVAGVAAAIVFKVQDSGD